MSEKTSVRTSNIQLDETQRTSSTPSNRKAQYSKYRDSTIHEIGVLLRPFSKAPCFPKKYATL